MKPCYVGIDTSNYTTSVAAVGEDAEIIANVKQLLFVEEGQRGLRQSDAVFAHVKNLPRLMRELSVAIEGYTPVAVGVSVTPRDAEGSYMPCFLVGKSAAYSFAAADSISVYETSHQNGHILAALCSAGRLDLLKADKFIAFHVSGGTTEAVIVRPQSGGKLDIELVGGTSDISAGQAIDRTGVAMGLSFPCGAELERLAAAYVGEPYRHAVCVRDGFCSLSGVENIAKKIYSDTADKSRTAAFVFDFIGRTLEKTCEDIIKKHGDSPVLFAGGVMSNSLMRERLSVFDAYFAQPSLSADNAVGAALLCREMHKNNKNI